MAEPGGRKKRGSKQTSTAALWGSVFAFLPFDVAFISVLNNCGLAK